ncbi:MAG: NAD(+) diphosphatase [Lysobacter sp.]|nr:MAG: NAD(+) diphosphatase [Lysobacter sp.]
MTTRADDAPFAFVASDPCQALLDRADHLRADADALAALWAGASVLLFDSDGRVVADSAGQPIVHRGAQIGDGPGTAVFLGVDTDARGWFALDAAQVAGVPDGRVDLRSAAATWRAPELSAFVTGRALQQWRQRHRYCGACGDAVLLLRGGWQGTCRSCALEHYPRTDPAVIVAVVDGRRLLMGRQRSWPERRYSVIAGFVEPGETLEQAVRREVHEETGVHVRHCRYLASQPWPFPGALMLGFIAEAEPGDAVAGDELDEARWFERDEIEAALAAEQAGRAEDGPFLMPARISIAHWLVRQWLAGAATR